MFDLIFLRPILQFSSYVETGQHLNVSCSRTQRSDASEAHGLCAPDCQSRNDT